MYWNKAWNFIFGCLWRPFSYNCPAKPSSNDTWRRTLVRKRCCTIIGTTINLVTCDPNSYSALGWYALRLQYGSDALKKLWRNLNFSSIALTTKTPITWKRYPTPSYSKWRLNNIHPNTLKRVTNARNWIFSLLATSKSIHLQNSQRLKKSESVQIIWVKSEKLLAHSTFEPGPSASKNLSLLRLSE